MFVLCSKVKSFCLSHLMLRHISDIFIFPFHIINICSAISKGNENVLPLITLTREMLLSQANCVKKAGAKKWCSFPVTAKSAQLDPSLCFQKTCTNYQGHRLNFTRHQTCFVGALTIGPGTLALCPLSLIPVCFLQELQCQILICESIVQYSTVFPNKSNPIVHRVQIFCESQLNSYAHLFIGLGLEFLTSISHQIFTGSQHSMVPSVACATCLVQCVHKPILGVEG